MRATKAIILVVGILVVFWGLYFLSAAFAGAGHGSYFFYEALLAPFSVVTVTSPICLILWPLVAILVGLRDFVLCRIVARSALVLHYAGIALLSFQTDWYYVGKVWRSMSGMVITFIGVYVAGQVFLWSLLARNPGKQTPPSSRE